MRAPGTGTYQPETKKAASSSVPPKTAANPNLVRGADHDFCAYCLELFFVFTQHQKIRVDGGDEEINLIFITNLQQIIYVPWVLHSNHTARIITVS